MKKSLFLYTFFPLLSFFIVSIGLIQNDNSIYAFFIILIFTTIFFKHILTLNVEPQIFYAFFIGFLVRFCLMYVDINISEIDPGDCRDFRDAAEYFFYTNRIAFRGHEHFDGTTLFMGIIDKIFGPHRVIIQYFNTLCFMSAAYLTYNLLCKFSVPEKIKLLLMLWMIFSPQSIKSTSASSREGFLSFFVAFSIYSFYLFTKTKNKKDIVLSFGSVFVGCLLHSGIIALIGGYIFYLAVYNSNTKKYELGLKSIYYLGIIIIFLLPVFILFGDTLLGKFGHVDTVEDITAHGASFEGGGSDYEVPFGDNILGTPLRAIYFILAPMPWNFRGITDMLSFILLSVPHILIMQQYIHNVKYIEIKKQTICHWLMVSAVCISIVFGWGCKNTGTAIRHRDKFTSLYVCMLGIFAAAHKDKEYIIKSNGKQKISLY